ncbi:MAG: signal peptidase I [Polyangiaceae bacterium]|nr:signal peptidase I [Polyangiaceae bacterium]
MRGLIRFLLWLSILTAIVLGGLRLTIFRTIRLPTNDPVFEASLVPSISGGDTILLSRVSSPILGDLVLCPEPDAPERFIIGRIIAEAGANIEIRDGKPYLNGKAFIYQHNCDPTRVEYPHPDNEGETVSQVCQYEEIGHTLHRTGVVIPPATPEDLDYDIPQDFVFLLSDNRAFPYDSRDYGLVPIDSCRETVVGRLWSRKGWLDADNRLNYIP